MLAGVVLALLGFEEVADDVFDDPRQGDIEAQTFDRAIGDWSAGLRSPFWTQVTTDLTALGSRSVLATLFVLLVSVLASFRDLKGIFFLSAVGLGAATLPPLLKAHFARPRPSPLEHLVSVSDLSFPSGHAFGAAAMYTALAYYSARYASKWGQEVFFYLLGGLLIATVGATRIYLGVHYPTDVLAGLAGGLAWGLSGAAVFEGLWPPRPRRPAAPPR